MSSLHESPGIVREFDGDSGPAIVDVGGEDTLGMVDGTVDIVFHETLPFDQLPGLPQIQ